MDYQRKDPLDYKDIAENLRHPAWYDIENDSILLDDAATAITDLLARADAAERERDRLREVLDMYGGEEGITAMLTRLDKSEAENKDREEASFREHADTHYWRDRAKAAEKCVDDVKWARVRSRPAYVVDEILQKFYAEKKEE